MYTPEAIKELQKGTDALLKNDGNVDQLRKVLRFHEYRYYILNDPLLSDQEYDLLFKKLEKLEKENPSIVTPDSPTQRVGSSLNSDFITVPHLVAMLSLENSYNAEDLIAWDNRLKTLTDNQKITFSAEPKYDGASISLIYENDLLVRGATRGDGAAGDDITTNMRQIGSIPLSAKFASYGIQKIEIRGEVLLNKENFKK
ncbi:MAG: DNA ligase (NAD(+)) LigA, partial [Ginsengibacter sp.]